MANVQITRHSLCGLRDLAREGLCTLTALLSTLDLAFFLSLDQVCFCLRTFSLVPLAPSIFAWLHLPVISSQFNKRPPAPINHITLFYLTLARLSAQHLTPSETVYLFTC